MSVECVICATTRYVTGKPPRRATGSIRYAGEITPFCGQHFHEAIAYLRAMNIAFSTTSAPKLTSDVKQS